ncbi:unnamed protein product [Clonostachys byssicola]|uniref:Peptidase A1 domain-containing protein n=1 Tax=Clonostachys byssicola TaxID=160290 RepID=A0A9N9U2Q1_9HYPO|nr:unnamed protein product [Clonostachys byssicola]
MHPYFTTAALTAFSVLIIGSTALHTTGNDQVTKYAIQRVRTTQSNASHAVSTGIANQNWLYTVELSIGTPPQKTLVQLDTGSSEMWVNANCSAAPTALNQKELCDKVPVYKVNNSSTAAGPLGSGQIQYGIGEQLTGVRFNYYQDTIDIGGIEIKDQIFGVAWASANVPIGILGLGPDLDRGFALNESHPLVLDAMAQSKSISSRVYSVGLGGANEAEGSLIFGGIDKGRYTGSLEKLPIVKSSEGKCPMLLPTPLQFNETDHLIRLTVDLAALSIHGKGKSREYDISNQTNVLLDTGYTMSKLNQKLARQIYTDIGAKLDESLGYYVVDCSVRDVDGGLDFKFGNKTIMVPFHEFIFTAEGICAAGLEPVEDGQQQVLGLSFLRAAYVVFDWDNENAHLAQSANCTSEILPATTGPDAVPSVVGNCEASLSTTNVSSTATRLEMVPMLMFVLVIAVLV